MKTQGLTLFGLFASVLAIPQVKRQEEAKDQPIRGEKGAPILGGTNKEIDLQVPSQFRAPSTDNGFVPNVKWSFSQSQTRLFPGGWSREQVIEDLPQSRDIAGAQQHLKKGAIRELHWHRVAEWGFVYNGSLLLTGVDENGAFQTDILETGDIWYFPKGVAHNVQGLDDENEYLLAFDDGDFEKRGTTFMVDDWIAHTPRDVLAKNFGIDPSVFDTVPSKFPYILNGTVSSDAEEAPKGNLRGDNSYIYHTYKHPSEPVPGHGGTFRKIDSTNFPISKTLAAAIVELEPKGLRELHWHPNAEEWLYFHQGQARATVFTGDSKARTFDFQAGDTAVFPDNSGHYVENTSETEKLVWIEIYKSDRVADIPLSQWLALSPADTVANVLNIDIEVVKQIKKEKQILIPGKE